MIIKEIFKEENERNSYFTYLQLKSLNLSKHKRESQGFWFENLTDGLGRLLEVTSEPVDTDQDKEN